MTPPFVQSPPMRSLVAASVLIFTVTVTAGCSLPEDASSGGGASESSDCGDCTTNQEQAFTATQGYLDLGTGFSRAGLIQQLTSKAGNGFKRADAVFAVDKIKPNYNRQAVLAAKGYLDLGTGFSRAGMIQQLTSSAGNQFTQEQAAQAANKVGLK